MSEASLLWRVMASENGVQIRTLGGAGQFVFVLPGLEGSGESCLHLAVPVVQRASAAGRDTRLALVDYSQEQHRTFEDLVATVQRLIRSAAGDVAYVLWGQSFGNLLVAHAATSGQSQVAQVVMVSPFTSLPWMKVWLGVASMAVTPRFLYRLTSPPPARVLFGPVGDRPDHPFFAALREVHPRDASRRMSWLSRDFSAEFAAATQPTSVWLGARDRLVDLKQQRSKFQALATTRPRYRLTLTPGAGHVFLPSPVVQHVHGELLQCLLNVPM